MLPGMKKSLLKEVMSHLGRSKSPAKIAAAKRNGAMPCRRGKKRGWPKGRKRGPRTLVVAA